MKPGQIFVGLAILAVAYAIYQAVASARESVDAAKTAVVGASKDLSHIVLPRDQDALGSPYNPMYWVSKGLDSAAELTGYLTSEGQNDQYLAAAK